jgi:hypothetical protein
VGVYYRLATGLANQSLETMVHQVRSNQIHGLAHGQNGNFPCAKAYFGVLPDDRDGVEFETDLPYSQAAPPRQGGTVFWYVHDGKAFTLPTNASMCFIPVTITKVRYKAAGHLQSGIDLTF